MKIVITGGSRGIGRTLAESLCKDNVVIIVSRSKPSVGKAAKDLGIKGYAADVSKYAEVEKAFKRIGPFDALINCAGVLGPVKGLQDTEIEEWEEAIRINLMGTVNSCKAAILLLETGGRSKIINLSGGGSASPRTYHGAYACSKAAVVRFTENLAKDLIHDGLAVDVNVIAPGAHKTGMWKEESFEKEPDCWADKALLIKLVRFLLSAGSDGISGKFLNIKDDYEKLDRSVTDSDLYTLRRIDNYKYRAME